MHMADALLSPAVGGTMIAVSAGILGYSIRDIRKTSRKNAFRSWESPERLFSRRK